MRTFTRVANMSPGLRDTGDEIAAEHINELQVALEDLQTGALPIPLAGIEAALGAYEPLQNMRAGVVNVLDHPNVLGDGSNDDGPGIQEMINEGAGRVVFPRPAAQYRINAPLVPISNQQWVSGSSDFQYGHQTGGAGKVILRAGGTGPIVEADGVNGVTFDGLTFWGNWFSNSANAIGVDLVDADFWAIRNCHFLNHGSNGLKWRSGVALRLENTLATACVMKNDTLSDYSGAVDLGGTDCFVRGNEFGSFGTTGIVTGYTAALVMRGCCGFFTDNVLEFSEAGLVIAGDEGDEFQNGFVNNRADHNYGHGYIVNGKSNLFLMNRSFRNGLAGHNTYDGFVVNGPRNLFYFNNISNVTQDVGTKQMRYGIRDTTTSVGADINANIYFGNYGYLLASDLYNIADSATIVQEPFFNRPTYTATNVTTDRSFDADSTSTAELADVLGTLIADLRERGIVK